MAGEQLLYNRPLLGARVNMGHPLSNGLISCFLFNEQMGLRAVDSSPYGNHGLLTNFPVSPQWSFDGLLFDGTNDSVNISDNTALQSSADVGSAEVWIQPYEDLRTRTQGFFDTNPGAGGATRIYADATDDKLYYSIGGGGAGDYTWLITADWTKVWKHMGLTWKVTAVNTTFLEFFVDGAKVSDFTHTNVEPAHNGLKLGYINTDYFYGKIGLFRMWNRAITPNNMAQLFLSPYAPMGLRMFF